MMTETSGAFKFCARCLFPGITGAEGLFDTFTNGAFQGMFASALENRS
jgi:hypothetical protein